MEIKYPVIEVSSEPLAPCLHASELAQVSDFTPMAWVAGGLAVASVALLATVVVQVLRNNRATAVHAHPENCTASKQDGVPNAASIAGPRPRTMRWSRSTWWTFVGTFSASLGVILDRPTFGLFGMNVALFAIAAALTAAAGKSPTIDLESSDTGGHR